MFAGMSAGDTFTGGGLTSGSLPVSWAWHNGVVAEMNIPDTSIQSIVLFSVMA